MATEIVLFFFYGGPGSVGIVSISLFSLMDKTTQNKEMVRLRNIPGLSSSNFKPKRKPLSMFEKNEVPINLPPGNLSFLNQYSTSALNGQNNRQLDQFTQSKKGYMEKLQKYCKNTTLHGLRYIGDPQLTYGERIFWFISFSVAIGCAAYNIINVYARWKSSPVIIGFSPFDTELDSIPFPAITICNMNQAKKTEAEKILKEGSTVEKIFLDDACNGNATFNNSKYIDRKSYKKFLLQVGNNCSDILRVCRWGSNKIACNVIFKNDLTNAGLCCSFNRLPNQFLFRNWKKVSVLNQTTSSNVYDWDAEKGFSGDENDDTIPWKPLGAGASLGLSVVLDAKADNYYCSSTSSTGFKVALTSPIQIPLVADHGFLVSPGFETRVAIEPSEREATSTLRSIPIEKRQCYFHDERPLLYYRKYCRKHCKFECQSVAILKRCGCIPYYLPKNDSTNLCPRNDLCTEETLALIEQSSNKYSNLTKEQSDNFAKVLFFFDATSFPKIKKMPLFNFTDLMAYTGGLLGLFIGFSFLSVVELLFHIIWLTWKERIMKKKPINRREENHTASPLYPFVN